MSQPTYLMPAPLVAIAAAFRAMDGWTVDANGIVGRNGIEVVFPVSDTTGGSVVRLAPTMDDGGLADLISDVREAETLRTYDDAAAEAEMEIVRLGGVPAKRTDGEWQAVTGADRAAWATHLADLAVDHIEDVADDNRTKWANAA